MQEELEENNKDANNTEITKKGNTNEGVIYFLGMVGRFICVCYIVYLVIFHRDIFVGNFFNWAWIILTSKLILITYITILLLDILINFIYGCYATIFYILFLLIIYFLK